MTCAQQQFTNETGKLASVAIMEFAAWFSAAPRQVCAKNATGSRFVGGPVGASAPVAQTGTTYNISDPTPQANGSISDPGPSVAPSPVKYADIAGTVARFPDGTFEVLLRQFPRKQTGMIMVWSADTFNGYGKNEVRVFG
jgi:hypothetical protein